MEGHLIEKQNRTSGSNHLCGSCLLGVNVVSAERRGQAPLCLWKTQE